MNEKISILAKAGTQPSANPAEPDTYYALTNISLDGEEYPIGTAVPVTAKQADQLGDAITTTQPLDVVQLPSTDDSTDEPDAVAAVDQVVAAIELLDAEDQTHWTKSGKPQLGALEAALGASVSGALRDAAWDVFTAENDKGD